MLSQNTKEEYNFLTETSKFKIEWLDDMSAWWFDKHINSELFGEVNISISDYKGEGRIEVFNKIEDEEHFEPFMTEMIYSRENLNKVFKIINTR